MKLTDKRFWIVIILAPFLMACSDRHDITDNYSVFTYGEGLYGEKETDYPIFAEKLGYKNRLILSLISNSPGGTKNISYSNNPATYFGL